MTLLSLNKMSLAILWPVAGVGLGLGLKLLGPRGGLGIGAHLGTEVRMTKILEAVRLAMKGVIIGMSLPLTEDITKGEAEVFQGEMSDIQIGPEVSILQEGVMKENLL